MITISFKYVNVLLDLYSVGKLIVTKKIGEVLPGTDDMEDITDIYKNPFGKYKNDLLLNRVQKDITSSILLRNRSPKF